MSSEEKLKQWTIIKFCAGLGHTPVQTMEMLNRSTKKPFFARSLVKKNGVSGTVKDGEQ